MCERNVFQEESEKDLDRPSKSLTHLGRGAEPVPPEPDPSILEVFDNPYPERDYLVIITTEEFSSLCPKTGQPDFGKIEIEYVPAEHCVESKSLKLYLQSYRNYGIFYEELVNRILADIVRVAVPKRCKVKGTFAPRGGITFQVEASFP